MKLNKDCIRDTLLFLEDKIGLRNVIYPWQIQEELNQYTLEEVKYTLKKLSEANIITSERISDHFGYNCMVYDITYNGHEFLETIRDNAIWEQAKLEASAFTSISIGILINLASGILSNKLGIS